MFVKTLLVALCLVCLVEARRPKKLNSIDNKDDFKKKKSDVEVTSVVTDIKSAKNIDESKNENKDAIGEETNEKKEELNKRDEIPHEEEQSEDNGETSEIRSPKRMRIDSAEEEEDYEEASTTSSGEDFSGNGDDGSDLISVKLNKDEMTLLHAIEALSKRQSIEKNSQQQQKQQQQQQQQKTPKKTKIRKATKKQHIAHHFKRTKQCEKVRRCSMPMTYAECAIPRCREKVRPVRGLCFWLCKHQKRHCATVCE